jgi:hypothetical protein
MRPGGGTRRLLQARAFHRTGAWARGLWLGATLLAAGKPARASDLPGWFLAVGTAEGEAVFPKADIVQLLRDTSMEIDKDGTCREVTRVVYHLRRGTAGSCARLGVTENSRVAVKSMRGWVGREGKAVREENKILRTTLFDEALYSESRDAILSLPEPAPGDLFGFQVEVEKRFPEQRSIGCFGRGEQPVVRWAYRLRLPKGWEARGSWAETVTSPPVVAPGTLGEDGWVSWAREGIPAEPNENPLAPPLDELAPAFFLQYRDPAGPSDLETWPGVARWFGEYCSEALADTVGFVTLVRGIAPVGLDARERAARIGEWVRANIGYVQVYLRDGEFRPHPVGETFRARYGDCKDMACLCVALLRASGIRAWPVLASFGQPGVVRPEIPSTFFNHAITAIGRPDGTLLFFDPTAKSVPFGRLPVQLGDARALVIGRSPDADLESLPGSQPGQNLARYHGTLRIADRGATGEVAVSYAGAPAWSWREALKGLDPGRRPERIRERLSRSLPGTRITSFEVSGLDAVTDSMSLRVRFECGPPGQRVNGLVLLQPDFLTWEALPCLADATPRETFLGVPVRVETEADIVLPDGWAVDDLPDSVAVENAIGLFQRSGRAEAGMIRLRRLSENRRARATADEFPEVRAWGDAGCRADRELVTIRIP